DAGVLSLDQDFGPDQRFYRAILETPIPSYLLKRCRFVKNKVGPCGQRGIWINGDFNMIESNDVHDCGITGLWEGVYVEGGQSNTVRLNRLIDCLPLLDAGTQTQALGNDHFWETQTAPA